ncbi:MAG TPA: hypothetical protein VJR06_07330, partial [Nitrososphaerales archaeon]|nr:hypothetical protein [Nitrososphaerales archaeon]
MPIESNLLALSSVGLLVTTLGVVLRRSLTGWVSAYRYESVALSASAAIIGYYTGFWEIYVAAALTFVVKVLVVPRLLVRLTYGVEGS